ncbi:MAG: O-methyltransferase [Planctomycetota bacterium]
MSKDSTAIGPEHFAFVRERTLPEDRLLRDLRAAARTAGLPEIHIAPEQAAFLDVLLRAMQARTVVEVGTLGGYSAIAMARALGDGGRLVTLEIEPAHAAFAREWIARAGLQDRVEVRLGDARATLAEIPDGSADAIFVDADKTGYVDYLRHGVRILRPGGVLLADNALAGGDVIDPDSPNPTARAIRAFHDAVAATPVLRPILVPIGDGCLVAVKDR